MMNTKDLFNDKSQLYAKSRPHYPKDLFSFMKKKCPGKERAWDCATGNGQAAVGLSNIFYEVEATDISAEQIKNRKERPNINYSVSAAETTSFEDNSFDLINVAQALHWFDLDKFWKEASRVLKPEGLFITYAYGWSNVSTEIDEIVHEKVRKPIEKYWAPNNQLCWNRYSDVRFPFAKLEVPQFEIINRWEWSQYADYLHSWSATRRCIDAVGEDFFHEATELLRKAWDKKETLEVKTPLTVICGYNWV